MFRQSLRAISIVFNYAPFLTIVKLLQIVLTATMAPLSIFFTQRTIDALSEIIIKGEDWNSLLVWACLLLFSMLFSSVGVGFLNGIMHIALRRKLNIGMSPDILSKFRKLDYASFEDKNVQDTLKRMSTDPQDKVLQLFLTITGITECTIAMIGSALIFAQVGWWFIAGFIVLLTPMIWLDFKSADIMNSMFDSQSTDERRLNDLSGLLSNKSSLFELKLFLATDYIANKWRALANTILETRVKTTIRSQHYFLISTLLFKGWLVFVLLGLVSAIDSGHITIGLFTALIASTDSILGNTNLLSYRTQSLRARYLLLEHYYKFMALPELQEGKELLPHIPPHIRFVDVVFSYPNTTKPILNGVSFEIRQGERVALVGENGAGKSTIIKLLWKLYQPDSGCILINGLNIEQLDTAALRQVFSVVFQDYGKYSLTLRENVAFGDISKLREDDALRAALRMGLAHNIAELDTPLGKLSENGIDISGGQWQRIAIARAYLPDSAFVILDEPTASLDPLAESEMYHSFAQVLKNRGCIMISHRLASARMADKIIVLSKGMVTEMGSHEQLMKAGGFYAQMFVSQSSWYQTDDLVSRGEMPL